MKKFIDKLKKGVKKVAKVIVDTLKALFSVVSKSTAKIAVGAIGIAFGIGGAVILEEGIHDRIVERKGE